MKRGQDECQAFRGLSHGTVAQLAAASLAAGVEDDNEGPLTGKRPTAAIRSNKTRSTEGMRDPRRAWTKESLVLLPCGEGRTRKAHVAPLTPARTSRNHRHPPRQVPGGRTVQESFLEDIALPDSVGAACGVAVQSGRGSVEPQFD